jgi:hypothetical protein
MGETAHHVLDHITDVVGIGAVTWLSLNGAASTEAVGAIVTMALGTRYAKAKWSDVYGNGEKP